MNTLFIEDNTNIIKAGLKRRSNLGNHFPKNPSNTNQDIIKQTLDMFQSIKRKQSKLQCHSGSTNDEEKQKNQSQSDSIQSSDNEGEQLNNDCIAMTQEEMNDNLQKDDYHSIWDNSDLVLNGIFDLNELNIFQLYKLRSLTYPNQRQVLLSNQKILLNFQNMYQLMAEMRKRKRQKFNNGIVSCYTNSSPTKFDFNNEDWKMFQNDHLQINSDIEQTNSFKQFEDYYNNYIVGEKNKMRQIKFNRYEEAYLASKNSEVINQETKKRAAEILKRKFLMDQKEEENNEEDNKVQSSKFDDYNTNIGSGELTNNSICNLSHSISTQDKLPKKFQIKKVNSIKQVSSELSLNSPRNGKSSKDNTPLLSSGNLSIFNISTFNAGATRRIKSIDLSGNQIYQQKIKQAINSIDNREENAIDQNQNNYSGVRSLNNLEFTDNEEDQANKSCSPLKKRIMRFQSQEIMNGLEIPLSNREQLPRKSTQNMLLPSQSLRLTLDSAMQSKLLINTNRFEQAQQSSPLKLNIAPQTETAKNSPMKSSQFNYFSFKNYQQPNQSIGGGNFLPKINQFNSNLPETQKPIFSSQNLQTSNTTQRMDMFFNDKKHLSASKSLAKQVFMFDKQGLINDSPLKKGQVYN